MKTHRSRGRTLIERPPHVEASLWRRLRFEAEMRCREALFHLHLPFARRVAGGEHRDKRSLGLDRGDFEQLSYAALLEAIDRFDPLVGAPFQSFARLRIKGAIADGLARASENGAQVRYARRMQAERMRSLAPDTPSASDPIAALGELAALLALGFIAESFEHPESRHANDPFVSSAWRDIEISLAKAVERLPQNEKTIIQNHYGQGVAFTEIARLLGLTKGRISQLHHAALKRLRDELRRLE